MISQAAQRGTDAYLRDWKNFLASKLALFPSIQTHARVDTVLQELMEWNYWGGDFNPYGNAYRLRPLLLQFELFSASPELQVLLRPYSNASLPLLGTAGSTYNLSLMNASQVWTMPFTSSSPKISRELLCVCYCWRQQLYSKVVRTVGVTSHLIRLTFHGLKPFNALVENLGTGSFQRAGFPTEVGTRSTSRDG